ncbi:hypothetical protein L228DRAFT_236893 [Xylona heveae TC161]|uniref:Uncharacterized protein n=1 Tax=Xylona heveae (strain CBS 132557 / TC161) TaxID=1328760 RepID=A0A165J7G4_XYLHT|nr:hypothetical protein L228DRAFT_236893 [Xylona heveae TC161]KZF25845.1 hypothetical protein L228DRAFT_236893 [Xylona heveae TC161]
MDASLVHDPWADTSSKNITPILYPTIMIIPTGNGSVCTSIIMGEAPGIKACTVIYDVPGHSAYVGIWLLICANDQEVVQAEACFDYDSIDTITWSVAATEETLPPNIATTI